MYLEKINGPEDVKKLSMEQLNVLAGEMREALFHRKDDLLIVLRFVTCLFCLYIFSQKQNKAHRKRQALFIYIICSYIPHSPPNYCPL